MNKQENNRGISPVRILIFLIAAALFVYAGYQLFAYLRENYVSKKVTQDLAKQAVTILETEPKTDAPLKETNPTDPLQKEEETLPSLSDTIPIRVDFDLLQAENPDIIAWIYCADTPINYPVVQGKDNQYYVSHMPDGRYNSSGSIFMDFRNSADLHDRNSLIYGHNMTNDTMFAQLLEYKAQKYYDKHPEMWILTKDRAYRVDLIAGAVVASDSDAYHLLDTKEDLEAHLRKYVEQSTFTTDRDLASVEQIVTLSTCSYEHRTARYVVLGSLLPIEYPVE